MKTNMPGDSKCPFHPLVGGHSTPEKGHLTIPKGSLWITRCQICSVFCCCPLLPSHTETPRWNNKLWPSQLSSSVPRLFFAPAKPVWWGHQGAKNKKVVFKVEGQCSFEAKMWCRFQCGFFVGWSVGRECCRCSKCLKMTLESWERLQRTKQKGIQRWLWYPSLGRRPLFVSISQQFMCQVGSENTWKHTNAAMPLLHSPNHESF